LDATKQSHEPAPQPQAVFIRPLKLRTPPDPLVSRKALRHRALLVLSLVRDSQTFPALRAASLQHDAAVLCRHSHTEAVGLAAATRVGLKCAPSLCHGDCVLHTNWSVESSSRETPNTSCRLSNVSKPEADLWRCATVRGRRGRRSVVGGHSSPFGFSPKISTPVENIVEKQVKWSSHRWKRLVFRRFRPGESP
jgi:hypothetical protein